MALIKQPQPEPQPTALDRIVDENTHCLEVMKETARVVFHLLWHSTDKTPQEVCDMMGTDAAKGFEAHAKLQELIYLIDPTWVPLVPPVGYSLQQDGSVLIGQ
jgi:hypothetical protein